MIRSCKAFRSVGHQHVLLSLLASFFSTFAGAGLVGSFVGGTFIEQWIRNDTQAQCQQTLCGTPTVHAPLCGSLFNGNIAPFIDTTIAGIIWCKSSPPTAYYDVHSFHEGARDYGITL